jgi:hypothetical protein
MTRRRIRKAQSYLMRFLSLSLSLSRKINPSSSLGVEREGEIDTTGKDASHINNPALCHGLLQIERPAVGPPVKCAVS